MLSLIHLTKKWLRSVINNILNFPLQDNYRRIQNNSTSAAVTVTVLPRPPTPHSSKSSTSPSCLLVIWILSHTTDITSHARLRPETVPSAVLQRGQQIRFREEKKKKLWPFFCHLIHFRVFIFNLKLRFFFKRLWFFWSRSVLFLFSTFLICYTVSPGQHSHGPSMGNFSSRSKLSKQARRDKFRTFSPTSHDVVSSQIEMIYVVMYTTGSQPKYIFESPGLLQRKGVQFCSAAPSHFISQISAPSAITKKTFQVSFLREFNLQFHNFYLFHNRLFAVPNPARGTIFSLRFFFEAFKIKAKHFPRFTALKKRKP